MYNASEIRAVLQVRGFRPWEILPYCYRPFDLRWIYWEPETSLLRRKVEQYVGQLIGVTPWIEARQKESGGVFCRGTVTQCLADNFGNGLSSFFPAIILESAGTLLPELKSHVNLSSAAEAYLSSIAAPPTDIFSHALATMHTPTTAPKMRGLS
jgi:hypothetical protein